MADEDELRIAAQGVINEHRKRHRPELGVDQAHAMTDIEQRTADRQQPERRQMIVGHAAADGRMRRVDQHDVHGVTSIAVGPPVVLAAVEAALARFSSFDAAFPQI